MSASTYRRRIHDSSALLSMLADLKLALDCPAIVERCIQEAPRIDGLYGFHWWLRRRKCKLCGRCIPIHAEKFCNRSCLKRWHRCRKTPYEKFKAAVVSSKHVAVPEAFGPQAKAALLIERGCCAYRNRAGFVRDIGVPRKPEDRGKVWSVE